MRRSNVRVIAVSNFTAGVLSKKCHTVVLPPGLSKGWFDTLVAASASFEAKKAGIRIVTTFRLADWRNKGLEQLLLAVASVGRSDIHVTVCGGGQASPELRRLVSAYPNCTLQSNPTDRVLATELASADLFILATRSRQGRNPSGEGFGLVLLEAQVAGTPVVAPAFGGSCDAFIDQLTGLSPTDETPESLAKVLDELLKDPMRMACMGKQAGEWARKCFAPQKYASRVIGRLL